MCPPLGPITVVRVDGKLMLAHIWCVCWGVGTVIDSPCTTSTGAEGSGCPEKEMQTKRP